MFKHGDRIRSLREEKGLSQKEFADRLKINRSTYARYETSATQPDYETLDAIATFHDVSVDYLLGRTKLKYRFNPDRQYDDLDDFLNDPILRDFAKKHLQGKTPAEIENIEKMFELIKKL